MIRKPELIGFLDAQAPASDRWKAKNRYYYESIERIVRFHIPPGVSVLEIGCATGWGSSRSSWRARVGFSCSPPS